MGEFLAFYATLDDATLDDKIDAWQSRYVPLHADLFAHILYKRGEPRQVLERAFDRYPQVLPYLTEIEPQLQQLTEDTVAELRPLFPRARLELDVVFLVCDFGFGGMTGPVGGRLTLVQCVEQHDSLPSLRSELRHELFHAFHGTVNPAIVSDGRVVAMLLTEGLATRDGMRAAPDLPPERVIFGESVPTDWRQRMVEGWPRVLARLAADLDQDDREARVRWLGFSPREDVVPEAAAYFVGARVADRLCEELGFDAVLRLHGDALDEQVRRVLPGLTLGP